MPQAQTVQIPKRLPLVIEPANRADSTAYDAKLVNAYIESGKGEEKNEYWVYQRPGLLAQSQPSGGSATGRGVFEWRGDIYSIFANTLYKNGVAVAGTVDTTNGVYRFSSCLGATPKLQLGNGVKGYNYDTSGGLIAISDPDFPTSFKKGWAYLDGTTYIIEPSAHILGSDINTPADWDALNDILAQIEPDQAVGLSKQLVYVIAFKQWTTEIFYDAGNASGSPLGRVEGAKVNYGCVSEDSPRDLDGVLFWVGSTRTGSPQVLMMDNLKAQIISTPAIERLLEQADYSIVYTWVLKLDGHRFYILTVKNENLTLVYDLDERMWAQWTDVNGNYLPIVDSCVTTSGAHILQHESNGRLYLASNSYATDNSEIITVDVITPNFDGGTRRKKTMGRLGIVSDQQAGSELMLRVNDDDYNSTKWSGWRTVDLSRKNPYLSDCGTFIRRVHHFRHQRPVRMPRIMAVDMQIDLGTL